MTIQSKKIRALILISTFLLSAQVLWATSILERITKVEDPELADCIRIAMKNIPLPSDMQRNSPSNSVYKKAKQVYDQQRLQTVRAVTESYAQIKLLDAQIKQITIRLEDSTPTPNALKYELVLAKADLESKQIQELAKLREVMRIIPRHAFGQIQPEQLNSWFILDVLDEENILVFSKKRPLSDIRYTSNIQFVTRQNSESIVDTMKDIMNDSKQLPLRIDVLHRPNLPSPSKQIHTALKEYSQSQSIEIDTDIRLVEREQDGESRIIYAISGKLSLDKREKQILYREETRITRAIRASLLVDLLETEELLTYVDNSFLAYPNKLPVHWIISHDSESLPLAQETAKEIQALAKEKGLEDYVSVEVQINQARWHPLEYWDK